MRAREPLPSEASRGRPEVDAAVGQLLARGEHEAATNVALRALGPEILGFLVHALGEADGNDAFSLFAEDLWNGLPGFRGEAALRSWAYRVARNASHRLVEARKKRQRLVVAISDAPGVSAVVDRIRTETMTFLRTEARTKLDQLRDELTAEERMLLALRIDRKMSWPELAEVWHLESGEQQPANAVEPPDPARAAARLRKRFQLLKDRIARRGRELGLSSGMRDRE